MDATTDKRSHLLAAGAEVMHQKGYNGTGVKEIVDAAGVPKGSFYNYFDSKEAFAVDALAYLSEGPLEHFRQALTAAEGTPIERIVGFYTDAVTDMKSKNTYCTGCFVGNLCQEMSDASPAIASAVESIFSHYEKALADALADARESGQLDTNEDVESLARFLMASWEGAIMRMKASKTATPLDAFLVGLKGVLRV